MFQSNDEIKLHVHKTTSLMITILFGSRSCRASGSYSRAIVQSNNVPHTNRNDPRNNNVFVILSGDNDEEEDDDDDNNVDSISTDFGLLIGCCSS